MTIESAHASSSAARQEDYGLVLKSWFLLASFVLAAVVLLLTPVLALQWRTWPFLGFVTEQTLVVADYGGLDWSGRAAGMAFPQKITHINGRPINSIAQLEATRRELTPGAEITVEIVMPDGTTRTYPTIKTMQFPMRDLLRYFWLPYGIGLVYLLLGVWVFRQRWQTRPGRAFALFCISAATVNALMFDLITTHVWPAIWLASLTLQGGSLIILAMNFPRDWRLIAGRPWLRYLPMAISLAMAVWGFRHLTNPEDPWQYVVTWRASYVYLAAGIVVFLLAMLFRLLTSRSLLIRQQVLITLIGAALAFTPIAVWLGAPLFGVVLPWRPGLYLPFLTIFPLSVGIAILRYRLWDLDVIINRTLVYGSLTAFLGAIYFVTVVGLQDIFLFATGEESPLAIAVSTLVTALLFNPVRNRLQAFIDRQFFRRKYDLSRTLATFSHDLQSEVDIDHLQERLMRVIQDTMHPTHVTLCSCVDAGQGFTSEFSTDDPLHDYLQNMSEAVEYSRVELVSPALDGFRKANYQLGVPMINQGELVGVLNLGPRKSMQPYSGEDKRLLAVLASQAAPMLRVAQLVRQQQEDLLERQRTENEMRVARLIQQTLLPREMPLPSGWSIERYYEPARAVGGDFYDFIAFPDGKLGVVVGDVTDKGVPAALVMASARSLIRSTALRHRAPATVLQEVNDLLHPDMPPGMFVTCLFVLLDPQNGQLTLANAGHNLPYRLSSGRVTEIWATGMPLGLMPEMSYEEATSVIAPGECLLLYSDGMVEAHNAERELFGFPRLKALLASLPKYDELIRCLLVELEGFTGYQKEPEDDITLVALSRAMIEESV